MNRIIRNAKVYNDLFTESRIVDIQIMQGEIVNIQPHIIGDFDDELDLQGKLLTNAFCDYHLHAPGTWLYDLFGTNLTPYHTIEEYRNVLLSCCSRYDLVRGFGWEMEELISMFSKIEGSPLQFLDSISNVKPIILFSNDFHSCWCNTIALEIFKKHSIDVDYFDLFFPQSETSGILHEGIAQKVFMVDILSFTDDELRIALKKFQDQVVKYGICEVYSFMFIGVSKKHMLDVLYKMDKEGLILINFNLCLDAYPQKSKEQIIRDFHSYKAFETQHIHFTSVKIYIDGVIDNHSAALKEDYSDYHNKGKLIWVQNELTSMCECSNQLGLPVHAHAIGDAAVACVLDSFLICNNRYGIRNIITHIQLCDINDVVKMRDSNSIACLQPFWFNRGNYAERVNLLRLGSRVKSEYRCNTFLQNDIDVIFSSDSPVTADFNPLLGIRHAVFDDGSSESITLLEAFKAYQYGLLSNKRNNILESIGEKANFIIFSNDIFSFDLNSSTRVLYTIIGDYSIKCQKH